MRRDGARIDVELTVSPMFDEAGAIIGAATVGRDISQRKQLDARLRLAVEAADLGVWDWNLLTNEIAYSDRAKAIFGFPQDAPVTFEMVRDATHPKDLPRTQEMSRRARDPAIREKIPYEYRIIRPDGAMRWVLAHGEAVFAVVNGAERAIRYAGCVQDITSQRETADALGRSEARLRLALDAGKMGVWEYDVATEALVGSPELNAVLGFAPDDTVSIEQMRAGYLPGEHERVRNAARKALESGETSFEIEYRYRWPDGSVHWLMIRAEFLSHEGKVARLVGIVCDVTNLKQAVEHRDFLINELNHRVKNTLATVQSMAVMTLKTKRSKEFAEAFTQRLRTLSATHDLLTESNWGYAAIDDVVAAEISPYSSEQITIETDGNPILLKPKAVLSLGLVFHELTTNAAKHGALSSDDGRLVISWRKAEDGCARYLTVVWKEVGGPMPKSALSTGFGSRLIKTTIEKEFGGKIKMDFAPDGLKAAIELPLENVAAG